MLVQLGVEQQRSERETDSCSSKRPQPRPTPQRPSHQDRRNGSDCSSFIFLGCHLTGLASGLLLTSSKWRWLPLSRMTYLPRDRSTQFQQPAWVSLACQPSTHRLHPIHARENVDQEVGVVGIGWIPNSRRGIVGQRQLSAPVLSDRNAFKTSYANPTLLFGNKASDLLHMMPKKP